MSARVSHRAAICLILAAWILAPIVGVLHAANDQHQYCAEHDRLEEAKEQGTLLALSDSTAIHQASHEDSPSDHEVCAFEQLANRDNDATLDAPASIHMAPVVQYAQPLYAGPDRTSKLLVNAPKTSPPARA